MTNWHELIGKRILIRDGTYKSQFHEWLLLEISPSGLRGKFENNLHYCEFWHDLDTVEVLEVLPDEEEL